MTVKETMVALEATKGRNKELHSIAHQLAGELGIPLSFPLGDKWFKVHQSGPECDNADITAKEYLSALQARLAWHLAAAKESEGALREIVRWLTE